MTSASSRLADRRRARLMVLRVLVLALLGTLVARLWYLQVRTGQTFRDAAAANDVRTVITPAVRGDILDDLGRPLVDNKSALTLSVDRNALMGTKDHGASTLARLASVLGTTPQAISEQIRPCTAQVSKPCWNGSLLQPVPIARNVSVQQALDVSEQHELYPGVTAGPDTVRRFPAPYNLNAAHILGYLSPVTEKELTAAEAKGEVMQRSDLVGRAGLEETYDSYLRGQAGQTQVSVDILGHAQSTQASTPPVNGDHLVTSIDARIQAVAERELNNAVSRARSQISPIDGKPYVADSAATVVMDARTGRVVAMASTPTYDPNVWTGGISQSDYAALTSASAGTPLLSRAYQGQFAPGSTFKAVTTAAMLQDGFSTGTYDCSPNFSIGGQSFHNMEGESYGPISLKRAIEVSCDTVFYGVAYQMWQRDGGLHPIAHPLEPIATMAHAFGLGAKTGIDLPGEAAGDIQTRAEKQSLWNNMHGIWCKRAKDGYPELMGSDPTRAQYLQAIAKENCADGYEYQPGDAVISAIGQGGDLVTPLQLARVYAAVANGGTLYQPQIGRALIAPDGKVVKDMAPIVTRKLPLSGSTLAFLADALHGTSMEGTAGPAFAGWPENVIPTYAKTGTAEVYGKQTTSCFVGYAGTETGPRYVVAMMVSQGGTGVGTSGPSVAAILAAIYGVDMGHPNPNSTLPTALPVVRPDGLLPALPPATSLPTPPPPSPSPTTNQ
ncbi:penicillin-binding protein 2 [Catenulispora sp. NL8]|uniref:Penicillin-binding protein 2 n=1 Tax=Catenulispora pinistramenti TaxID=2705254 RepID=A0ABS5L3Q3_9ACTN|nr:penicillin-binding protein 2 [Catenulispora pinistramenti]MBS2552946.1 penicillin-binding protein 2 [Catenulispora pinistramenti]